MYVVTMPELQSLRPKVLRETEYEVICRIQAFIYVDRKLVIYVTLG